MSCDTGGNKKIGETWNFFFKVFIDGVIQDLNGYSYSYILVNSDGESVKEDTGTIGVTGEELTIPISGIDTALYSEGKYTIEIKWENTAFGIAISNKSVFHAVGTLHSTQ